MSQIYENPGHKLSVCKKIGYPTKEIADKVLRRIKEFPGRNKKPIRSYECKDCHEWHLTSLPYGRYKASKDFEERGANDFVPVHLSRWQALLAPTEVDTTEI